MTTNTNTNTNTRNCQLDNPTSIKALQRAITEMQERLRVLMQQPCKACGACSGHDCICLDENEG